MKTKKIVTAIIVVIVSLGLLSTNLYVYSLYKSTTEDLKNVKGKLTDAKEQISVLESKKIEFMPVANYMGVALYEGIHYSIFTENYDDFTLISENGDVINYTDEYYFYRSTPSGYTTSLTKGLVKVTSTPQGETVLSYEDPSEDPSEDNLYILSILEDTKGLYVALKILD